MTFSFREQSIRSFIDLRSGPFLSITARSPIFWLTQKKFSNWGPSMVLHPNTREYYREGSKKIDDDFIRKIIAEKSEWMLSDQSHEEVELFRIRLRYYVGIYDEADDLDKYERSPNPEIRDWARYLLDLKRYVISPSIFKLSQADLKVESSEEINLLYSSLLINSYCQNLTKPGVLMAFEKLVDNWPIIRDLNGGLQEIRRIRSLSAFLYCTGQLSELSALNSVIKFLFSRIHSDNFLEVEGIRRLIFYHATRLCMVAKFSEAYELIHLMSTIDPYCSAVICLKGIVEDNLGLTSMARSSYELGYSIGFNERAFCFKRLSELSLGKTTALNVPKEIDSIWFTGKLFKANRFDKKKVDELIKQTTVYKRFPAFWTLQNDNQVDKPYWYRQTGNALDVQNEQKDFFFETCYFQSLQPTNFRQRILKSAYQEIGDVDKFDIPISEPTIRNNYSLDSGSEILLDGLHKSKDDARTACYFSRIFMYFGFEIDAVQSSNWVWGKEKWDAFDSYLAYTNLLLSYRSGNDQEYFQKSVIAFSKFPNAPETLRMKFMLCIQSGGYFGKLGDLPKVKHWADQGRVLLDNIMSSTQFLEREKILLCSRWYRFSSFIPHLQKDREKLVQETDLYIDLANKAYQLFPSDYTRENMYAVYETRARIAEALGDKNGAYNWFIKLRDEIDPFDSKVEINLGDMQQKMGNLENAYKHYNLAMAKGPPLRDMAIYKMAEVDQNLDRIWSSIFMYSRFLELNPESAMALEQLKKLFSKLNVSYL